MYWTSCSLDLELPISKKKFTYILDLLKEEGGGGVLFILSSFIPTHPLTKKTFYLTFKALWRKREAEVAEEGTKLSLRPSVGSYEGPCGWTEDQTDNPFVDEICRWVGAKGHLDVSATFVANPLWFCK